MQEKKNHEFVWGYWIYSLSQVACTQLGYPPISLDVVFAFRASFKTRGLSGGLYRGILAVRGILAHNNGKNKYSTRRRKLRLEKMNRVVQQVL